MSLSCVFIGKVNTILPATRDCASLGHLWRRDRARIQGCKYIVCRRRYFANIHEPLAENIRPSWKSLFVLLLRRSYSKKFYSIDTCDRFHKHFTIIKAHLHIGEICCFFKVQNILLFCKAFVCYLSDLRHSVNTP
jgi:hypothetical protein